MEEVVKEEGVDPQDVSGFIDYNQAQIYVEKDAVPDCLRESIIHELMHALLDRPNLELIAKNSSIKEIVENIVEYLTPRIHALLVDNPKLQKELLNISNRN